MTNSIKKISSPKEMQSISKGHTNNGKTVSFVPTMGALHKGHLSLVEKACELADVTVVSIFVNPTQFGPNEDFKKYTRDLQGDIEKLSGFSVDYIFCPEVNNLYPEGFQTFVEVGELQKPLCGANREGHFKGVATIVLKLFNIVKPTFAIFGEKDYQQLKIIQRLVKDLDFDIEIVGLPIFREENGLAMSSRNSYLSSEEKKRASYIYKSLIMIRDEFKAGCSESEELIKNAKEVLAEAKIENIEYLEIRDPESLELKSNVFAGDIAAIAVRINNTRLIDNIKI